METDEIYVALLELFSLLALAQGGRLLLRKYFIPALVAEIIVGIVFSPYALGGVINSILQVNLFSINNYVVLFANFSVILLIFAAGLSHGFKNLRSSGFLGFLAATLGAVIPTYLVFVVFSLVYDTQVALLMGAASAATSLAATVSIVDEYKLYRENFSRLLISAAAIDDVVALIILSTVVELITLGSLPLVQTTLRVLELSLAWIVIFFVAVFLIPKILTVVRDEIVDNISLVILFVLVLIMLVVGFSPVIAAFIAGVAIAESVKSKRVNGFTETLISIFGPLFFVYVGMETPFYIFFNLNDLLLGLLLSFLAIVGKIFGILPVAYFYTKNLKQSIITAVGMIPRGEIGLVVATVGLSGNVLDVSQYSQIVIMALITTFLGSYIFSTLIRKWIIVKSG
ncbi:cation:proton antiporter [Sulfolobus acidocaldarius]|uniref:Transporter protein n=4 Tax=Sulfolobus acidocaldarius TaxID=2285 RepID=Q4JBP9_SULAC|nr:cation:proton antiporter [Sulfolobus acidocaldarius]AAY79780.1 transporter protein [Sulfolobus acidocaldarius DSM 639]AGE70338.1 transporter protein [Sulfolobus acidocaldarius N8]AGE72613.1 transporter protein [Sulfolobus acidocaldarius Ron12/I]ALU29263.1 sodium:proton antiporter [Sulfolobus acidocaldarius]ALU31992.1 sodium:proton antiporter [Sulfolobus acidocaldarius]